MQWEGLLEFASRQTGFSSSGRIVIVGPIHRKCPGMVVVAVDNIAKRCKQATEASAAIGLERMTKNRRHGPCHHLCCATCPKTGLVLIVRQIACGTLSSCSLLARA